jgi:23S rRNA (cytidine1920-2'-O)/16S rRNA (cytidine1409-2'-O)-methyltransferase
MRSRLDTALVARGLVESREQAKRLILAGAVRVAGQVARKPSDLVADDADLKISAAEKYVSRGGYKLEAALSAFGIPCRQAVAVDLGASTGGFTDCLLQHGARRVHAVDVGRGQLAWRLRQDPRIVLHEGGNARAITPEQIGEPADIVTVDVSFISLAKVLPAAVTLLRSGGVLVALIKPQFEAGKKFVKRGGIVRDSAVHEQVKSNITALVTGPLGLRWLGTIESPLRGPAGNKEFLLAARKP